MKMLGWISCSLFLISCSTVALSEQPPMQTVERVELNRYLGDWYEVASYPQWFQKNCYCTRARYTIRHDGKIGVLNTCNRGSAFGELDAAHGTAKVADAKTNAKLKVSFFWPFTGDYWIIGLDKDYRYAVVSGPDRSTLWILSRTPELNETLLAEAKAIAVSQGLDLSKLVFNDIKGCAYQD